MSKPDDKKILDFWTLCEIVDFDKMKLNTDIAPLHIREDDVVKTTHDDFMGYNPNKKEYYKKTSPNQKKQTIYRLYIGLIKTDEAIRFIYRKLKERSLLPLNLESLKKMEEDLEKLPLSNEYTYMAYIYLDENHNIISLMDDGIVINPLFYILKSLLDKSLVNKNAYDAYIKKESEAFRNTYKIERPTEAYIIPDMAYFSQYYKVLSKIDAKIIILPQLTSQIKSVNKDASDFLETESTKENSNFIFPETFDVQQVSKNLYLNYAIAIANNKYGDNVYLLTKDQLTVDDTKIPVNLYLITFLNTEQKLYAKTKYSTDTSNRKVTHEMLDRLFQNICEKLYLTNENNHCADIFYKEPDQKGSFFIRTFYNKSFNEIEEVKEDIFLSFYINALDENPAKLTIPYIAGANEKIDINSGTEIRKQYNSLAYFKNVNARWVSEFSLKYAQQMAVNQFLNKLHTPDNIMSVNGPPGTGKTTLLKDIVAETVTRRILHVIDHNESLFDKSGKFNQHLCGKFEIVVASNNNAAVENITRELPKEDEFGFDYIGFRKSDFLLQELADQFYGFDAWNFISINLGKGANVKNFKDKFENLKNAIEEQNAVDNNFLENRKELLINQIKACREKLRNCHQEFELLEKEEDNTKKIQSILNEIEQLEINISTLNKQIEVHKNTCSNITNNIDNISAHIERAREIIALKEDEIKKYGFLKKIIHRRDYQEIKISINQYKNELLSLLESKHKLSEQKDIHLKEQKNLSEELNTINHSLKEQREELAKCESIKDKITSLKEKDLFINDDAFYRQPEDSLQKSTLYSKASYQKEKALLFGLSMQLQEVLFLLHFDQLYSAINNFINEHKKDTLTTDQKEELKRNFAALSFFMPVISTSLAASYHMFKNIDSFGILLCDEAGQATPQSLVGLLNRANNALIVGDPLQVEPVFTAPSILVELMREIYNINEIYAPTSSSAQRLADNANSLGSYYKVKDKDVWVGLPLVVHRRCVDPMFSISNKISYNDKMVLETPALQDNDPINSLPPSSWINVVSEASDFENSNCSIKEINVLKNFIQEHSDILANNFYVISPFKDIYQYSKDFPEKSTGTVHTFQGKENDVVFFVLGGNVSREGAKSWVSSKANILNVATTRAKKRIYFIGDYHLWKKHPYFKDAINIIGKHIIEA